MRRLLSRLKENAQRSIAKSLLPLSTFQARTMLRKNGCCRILVDSSVLGHAITHETAWISTGPKMWGHVEIQTGYAARIPVHSPQNEGRVYREVQFLAGIAYLAKKKLLKLQTSAELSAEQWRQPAGRFSGYGWFDYNVFKDIKLESVDGFNPNIFYPDDDQLERVASCSDPLFKSLLDALGDKASLDAYHIFTAEKFGLYAFLHIDFPLREKVRQSLKKPPFKDLKTKILLPSEFAHLTKIRPIHTNLLTLGEAGGFFTRPDLHWDTQQRKRWRPSE